MDFKTINDDPFEGGNSEPDIMDGMLTEGLTKDQSIAFGKMSQMYSIFKLKGYAGTGKTYLLKKFICSITSKRVVVTAPTHKAVGVANGDSTIHSYLSLKIKYDKDKQVLAQMPFLDNVRRGDLVIIDEASMISKELLRYILDAQNEYELYIIFIGDPAQIPPVGERISPIWEIESPEYMLTDIVRQARDSNIISLATAVREGTAYQTGISRFVNNEDVYLGGINELRSFYFDCMGIDANEFPQIISYRNKIVDSSNTWARNIVKDNPVDDFLVGEEVYIRTAGEEQIHKLEDIVKIAEISKPFSYAFKNLPFKMMVKKIFIRSYKGEEELIIPASENDTKLVQKNKSAFANKAKARRISWGVFWKFSNSISVIKHIYSMTCHRSQGSTFKNVAVNCNDISDNRLMYTAVTRASDKLFLYRQ